MSSLLNLAKKLRDSLDQDKSMGGFQLAKGGLSNQVKNTLSNAQNSAFNSLRQTDNRLRQNPLYNTTVGLGKGIAGETGVNKMLSSVLPSLRYNLEGVGVNSGLINSTPQYRNFVNQQASQSANQFRQGATDLALTLGSVYSAPLKALRVAPATIKTIQAGRPIASLLGGTIGGIGSALSGGDVAEGVGQGAMRGLKSNLLAGTTSPLLGRFIPTKNTFVNNRIVPMALNVAQGVGIDKTLGYQTDPTSIAIDAVMGFAGGRNAFKIKLSESQKLDEMWRKSKGNVDNFISKVNQDITWAGGEKEKLWQYYLGRKMRAGDIAVRDWIKKNTGGKLPGYIDFSAEVGGVKPAKFREPLQKGDITKLENSLDEILGTSHFQYGNGWRDKLPARKTARQQLDYYAEQGEEEAIKLLKEADRIEDELATIRLAKENTQAKAKLPKISAKVGGINQTGTQTAGRIKVQGLAGQQGAISQVGTAPNAYQQAKIRVLPGQQNQVLEPRLKLVQPQVQSGRTTVIPNQEIVASDNIITEVPTAQNVTAQTAKPGTSLAVRNPGQLQMSAPSGDLDRASVTKPLQTALQPVRAGGLEGIPPGKAGSGVTTSSQQASQKSLPSFNVLDELYTQAIDRFHPLSKLARAGGQDKEMARKLAGYYGSGSTATYHLESELSPILKQHDIGDLRQASIALRNVELQSRGIQGSPEQKQAVAQLQALEGKLGKEKMTQLGETLQQLYKYQDNMVRRYLVDTGIMSKESYSAMRQNNQFYVPMKRVMDQVDEILGIPVKRGAGSVGKQNVIFKMKGSDKEIVDPIQSIVENTYKLVSLGKRQEVAEQIAKLQSAFPDVIKQVTEGNQNSTISLFKNGKKVYYSVPQEVVESARGMGEEQLVMLAKILKLPTDVFRTMTTGINPEFMIPNVSRDLQSVFLNGGVNPFRWVAGLAHMVKNDDVYKDFLKAGGLTSSVSINEAVIKQTAEELSGKKVLTVKSPKDILRGLELLSQYSEQPTRVIAFQKAYKDAINKGLSQEDALLEGAYWAQESTVNFARRGSKMPNINAIYAYLNARMQGVDRMIRTAKNDPKGFSTRIGFGIVAPAIALYAWNSQYPEYYDDRIVSKRDKQDNFIFMLPGQSGRENGIRYIKVPKAEIGKITNPVESFLEFSRGRGGSVWESTKDLLMSFSPIDNWGGTIPTAIRPMVEAGVNKNFYTGYDIVPTYKKNLPAGFQDSSYTSPIARMIGQNTNISPAKLQHMAEGYGGGLVRIAEMATQPLVPSQYVSDKNEQGAQINRIPVLRRFLGGDKRSAEEQQIADDNKNEAITGQINAIHKLVLQGKLDQASADKQIEKLQSQKKNVPISSGTTQARYLDENGSMQTINYGKFTKPEPTSAVEKIRFQEDKFKTALEVYRSDMPDEQKDAIFSQINASKDDLAYYDIATDSHEVRKAFTYELLGSKSESDFIETLSELRKEVGSQRILTDTVIDDLYNEGVISSADKKYLKSLKWNAKEKKVTAKAVKSGSVKVKKAKKPKKVTLKSAPKSSFSVKFNAPQTKKIRIATSKVNLPKIKLPTSAKSVSNAKGIRLVAPEFRAREVRV